MKNLVLDTTICPKCGNNEVRNPQPGKQYMWFIEDHFKLACGYCGHKRQNPNVWDFGVYG